MEQSAQGFVEVTSYVAAIEAADAMAKAAEVVIAMNHKVDGPDLCVICEGDVAACKAAVSAGEAVALARGALIATNIIARPDQRAGHLFTLMREMQERKTAKKTERLARRAAGVAGKQKLAAEKSSAGKTPAKKTAPGK